jgi:type III restriction enzyme
VSLFGTEPNWTIATLANWLDRQIPHPDIPQSHSSLFIHNALTHLIESRTNTLDRLARLKYHLRGALENKIDCHRRDQHKKGYQAVMFGPAAMTFEVDPSICAVLDEDRYAPNWYYEGPYRFNKQLFKYVGELESQGEEFECAAFLDGLPEVNVWVHNLSRGLGSFCLQTSTDRFYPDFVVLLRDGRFLVVEYKNAKDWSNDDSKEKRKVGELWDDRSRGRCLFVMPQGKDWGGRLARSQRRRRSGRGSKVGFDLSEVSWRGRIKGVSVIGKKSRDSALVRYMEHVRLTSGTADLPLYKPAVS